MGIEVTQNLTQVTISTAGVQGPKGETGADGAGVDTSAFVTTSSLNEYSSSQSDVNNLIVSNLNELYDGQESLNQFTSSYSIESASFASRIESATNEQDLSNLATTGSNSFIGNQQITGSVYIEEGEGLFVGPGSVFASVEGFTLIQDTSGYIQLDASNNDGSQNYISLYFNANSDENLFTVYDNTPNRINASINLSTSGSFNISTRDNTATLLINDVLYDAHLVSTSSLNNLISLFNTFTASAATTGSNDFVGDQSIDGILYLKDPGNELGDVAQIVNNTDALYISSQDDRKIVLSVYSGSVYEWQFGSDGDLTVPGNINGVGNLATTGSNTFNGNQTINGTIILENGAIINDNPNYGISFGYLAANENQGTQAVAIGSGAGNTLQGNLATAVGANAGALNQGPNSVAIGGLAATAIQGTGSVAIGTQAGAANQGDYSIALGYWAGITNQAQNSIILNATGAGLNNTIQNALVVAPIRNVNGDNGVLQYNTTTNEVSYATTLNGITNLTTTASFNSYTSSTDVRLDSIEDYTSSLKGAIEISGQDVNVLGMLTAQQFNVTYVSSSTLFQSGSTKFGDTSDDRHEFTGSLNVSGSVTIVNEDSEWNFREDGVLKLNNGTAEIYADPSTNSVRIGTNSVTANPNTQVLIGGPDQTLKIIGSSKEWIFKGSGDFNLTGSINGAGNLATTGSNTFIGEQTITGSVSILGDNLTLTENGDIISTIDVGGYTYNVTLNADGLSFVNQSNDIMGIGTGPGGGSINTYAGKSFSITTDDNNNFWLFNNDGDLSVAGNVNNAPNLATTGSNTFVGDQTITGSVEVSGSITTHFVQFDTTPTVPTPQPGTMWWNEDKGTTNLRLKGNNVTLQVGQELVTQVYNASGVNWLEEDYPVVFLSGSIATDPKAYLAQADDVSTCIDVIGIATETINAGEAGFITTYGLVHDIDTSMFNEGDTIYLSPTTPGGLTNVRPGAPDLEVIIGTIINSDPTGSIYVNVRAGFAYPQYIEAFNSASISGSANTETLIPFTTTVFNNGISIVDNTKVTVSRPGIYSACIAAQINKVGNAPDDEPISFWLKKGGTNVDFSATNVIVAGNAATADKAFSKIHYVDLDAGDYIEFAFSVPDEDLVLSATATQTTPTRPAAPSANIYVSKIG